MTFCLLQWRTKTFQSWVYSTGNNLPYKELTPTETGGKNKNCRGFSRKYITVNTSCSEDKA